MNPDNKPIHGKLLIITGIFHLIVVLLPGVFGAQMLDFASHGFFNVNKGLSGFPLFGGTVNYESATVFLFFYLAPILIVTGHIIDTVEKINGHIPRQIAVHFLIFSSIGAYMVPISGMTFFLVPQSVYMLLKSNRNQPSAKHPASLDGSG